MIAGILFEPSQPTLEIVLLLGRS
ncbi:hypothetical protein LINPERHAP1_LOCUS22175 [Linum perenne]